MMKILKLIFIFIFFDIIHAYSYYNIITNKSSPLKTHRKARTSNASCGDNLLNKNIICYYNVDPTFRPHNINPCLCSHVIYSYVAIKQDFSFSAGKKGDLISLLHLKQLNKNLKVIISIRPNTKDFHFQRSFVTNKDNTNNKNIGHLIRAKLARRILDFVKRHTFDGVDIDWEHFIDTNDETVNKDSLITLIRLLKSLFKGSSENGQKYFISVTTSKHPRELIENYDFLNLNQYIDFASIPAFGFDSEGKKLLHPSKLHGIADMENMDSLIDLILAQGLLQEKLIIGVPSYGYKYKLINASLNTPGSPSVAWINEKMLLPYSKICNIRDKSNWTIVREKDLTSPYMYHDNIWIGFDDEISIKLKAKYSILRNLSGLALWDTNSDDPFDNCGYGPFPLLQTIYFTFTNSFNHLKVNSSNLKHFVDIVEKYGQVTQVEINKSECKTGYSRIPDDCSRFSRCIQFNDKFFSFRYQCPLGLVFDYTYQICNWPSWSPSCTGSGEILQADKFSCRNYGYFHDPYNCQYFYYCSNFGDGSFRVYKFKCPFDLGFDEEKLLCNWKWTIKGCGNVSPNQYDSSKLNDFLQTIPKLSETSSHNPNIMDQYMLDESVGFGIRKSSHNQHEENKTDKATTKSYSSSIQTSLFDASSIMPIYDPNYKSYNYEFDQEPIDEETKYAAPPVDSLIRNSRRGFGRALTEFVVSFTDKAKGFNFKDSLDRRDSSILGGWLSNLNPFGSPLKQDHKFQSNLQFPKGPIIPVIPIKPLIPVSTNITRMQKPSLDYPFNPEFLNNGHFLNIQDQFKLLSGKFDIQRRPDEMPMKRIRLEIKPTIKSPQDTQKVSTKTQEPIPIPLPKDTFKLLNANHLSLNLQINPDFLKFHNKIPSIVNPMIIDLNSGIELNGIKPLKIKELAQEITSSEGPEDTILISGKHLEVIPNMKSNNILQNMPFAPIRPKVFYSNYEPYHNNFLKSKTNAFKQFGREKTDKNTSGPRDFIPINIYSVPSHMPMKNKPRLSVKNNRINHPTFIPDKNSQNPPYSESHKPQVSNQNNKILDSKSSMPSSQVQDPRVTVHNTNIRPHNAHIHFHGPTNALKHYSNHHSDHHSNHHSNQHFNHHSNHHYDHYSNHLKNKQSLHPPNGPQNTFYRPNENPLMNDGLNQPLNKVNSFHYNTPQTNNNGFIPIKSSPIHSPNRQQEIINRPSQVLIVESEHSQAQTLKDLKQIAPHLFSQGFESKPGIKLTKHNEGYLYLIGSKDQHNKVNLKEKLALLNETTKNQKITSNTTSRRKSSKKNSNKRGSIKNSTFVSPTFKTSTTLPILEEIFRSKTALKKLSTSKVTTKGTSTTSTTSTTTTTTTTTTIKPTTTVLSTIESTTTKKPLSSSYTTTFTPSSTLSTTSSTSSTTSKPTITNSIASISQSLYDSIKQELLKTSLQQMIRDFAYNKQMELNKAKIPFMWQWYQPLYPSVINQTNPLNNHLKILSNFEDYQKDQLDSKTMLNEHNQNVNIKQIHQELELFKNTNNQITTLSPLTFMKKIEHTSSTPESVYLTDTYKESNDNISDNSESKYVEYDDNAGELFYPMSKTNTLHNVYESNSYSIGRNLTQSVIPESACTRPGLFQHPTDCNKLYECYWDKFINKFTLHLFECPIRMGFDARIVACNAPDDPTVCVQY